MRRPLGHVVRVGLGVLAVALASPLLGVGGALAAVAAHRGADGTFGARLAPVRTAGYAVVVPDVDALLRADLPFARAGQTTVRLSAQDAGAPVFVGLASPADVAGYLAQVAHVVVDGIGMSASAMPVTLAAVDGDQPPPSLPGDQHFWVASAAGGRLDWSAASVRGRHLSLVLMHADAAAGLAISARAAVRPAWLVPTAWAMIALGVLGVAATVALLLGPVRRRDVVYLVSPERAGPQAESTEPGPPPHRPAGEGRVWASAWVRTGTLTDALRAPTQLASPVPSALPEMAHPEWPPPLVTPEWITPEPRAADPDAPASEPDLPPTEAESPVAEAGRPQVKAGPTVPEVGPTVAIPARAKRRTRRRVPGQPAVPTE